MSFYSAKGILIHGPDHMEMLRLGRKQCFIVMMRGRAPERAPINDPGNYEIDALSLQPGDVVRWPMMVLTVPRKHARAFESMPVAQVDSMIKEALAAENTSQ